MRFSGVTAAVKPLLPDTWRLLPPDLYQYWSGHGWPMARRASGETYWELSWWQPPECGGGWRLILTWANGSTGQTNLWWVGEPGDPTERPEGSRMLNGLREALARAERRALEEES